MWQVSCLYSKCKILWIFNSRSITVFWYAKNPSLAKSVFLPQNDMLKGFPWSCLLWDLSQYMYLKVVAKCCHHFKHTVNRIILYILRRFPHFPPENQVKTYQIFTNLRDLCCIVYIVYIKQNLNICHHPLYLKNAK